MIADAVDDVVILAKAMVTEEMTIDQAIDKVLEKYPNFKNEHNEEQKGFKIGAHDVKQRVIQMIYYRKLLETNN